MIFCDFCRDELTLPVWVHPTKNFVLKVIVVFGEDTAAESIASKGAYKLCDPCHFMFEKDDKTDVEKRMAEAIHLHAMESNPLPQYIDLANQLANHILAAVIEHRSGQPVLENI